jgi:hypothetical protein
MCRATTAPRGNQPKHSLNRPVSVSGVQPGEGLGSFFAPGDRVRAPQPFVLRFGREDCGCSRLEPARLIISRSHFVTSGHVFARS